jgi:hypothetical protein
MSNNVQCVLIFQGNCYATALIVNGTLDSHGKGLKDMKFRNEPKKG